MAIIVIDPGHGGSKRIGKSSPNNATGKNGLLEKDVCLDLGLLLSTRLFAEKHEVHLTRSTDINLGLIERAAVAKKATADVFISIHLNGDNDRSIQGTETFHHSDASDESKLLSALVQARLVAATGLRNRGVKSKKLGVINPASHYLKTAACLAEVSFLTDPNEESRLKKPSYLDKLTASLSKAVHDFSASMSIAD